MEQQLILNSQNTHFTNLKNTNWNSISLLFVPAIKYFNGTAKIFHWKCLSQIYLVDMGSPKFIQTNESEVLIHIKWLFFNASTANGHTKTFFSFISIYDLSFIF